MRSAGFTLTPLDGRLHRLAHRPSTGVPLVEDGSVLEIDFAPALTPMGGALDRPLLLPTRIRCLFGADEAWRCDIRHSPSQTDSNVRAAAAEFEEPNPAWLTAVDALQQIQSAWDVSSLPPPTIDDPVLGSDGGTHLAQCSARAWYAAMRTDCAMLFDALQRVREFLGRSLMSESSSTAALMMDELCCLGESLIVTGAGDAPLLLLETMHRHEAAVLPACERRAQCLRATASGRFWQADHIARAALCCDTTAAERELWQRIREQLQQWRLAPSQSTAAGGDLAVIELGAWIAAREGGFSHAPLQRASPLRTTDGYQSGECAQELSAIFAEWDRRQETSAGAGAGAGSTFGAGAGSAGGAGAGAGSAVGAGAGAGSAVGADAGAGTGAGLTMPSASRASDAARSRFACSVALSARMNASCTVPSPWTISPPR
jgi:hypothetical protein